MNSLFHRVNARDGTIRYRQRALVLIGFITAAILVEISPASAHSVYDRRVVGSDGNMCQHVRCWSR